MLVVGIVYLIRYARTQQQQRIFEQSHEGAISSKIRYCQQQIKKVENEKERIQNSIIELKQKLNTTLDITAAARTETNRLIAEFQEELNLRETKLGFYETCISKLQALLHNYDLSKTLEEKQNTLRQLREKNLEEIVNLEQLKSDIAYEKSFLSTIDTLSLRMLDTNSVKDAQIVQRDLELMTRELKDLD